MKLFVVICICCQLLQMDIVHGVVTSPKAIRKRALEKSHEKPQNEKWMDAFFGKRHKLDQIPSLVFLLKMLTKRYFDCSPIVLYDTSIEESDDQIFLKFFKDYPLPVIHGQIINSTIVKAKHLLATTDNKCQDYILFLTDVIKCRDIIGQQPTSKVIVIAKSSQWRVHEFLSSEIAQSFVNLLVIVKSETSIARYEEAPYILYTHKLYTDALGSSLPQVLTSWQRGNLTRPNVQLFPNKMHEGFAGHRFIVSLANQPPFVIKQSQDENNDIQWDGREVRLLKLLAEIYNFTIDLRGAKETHILGSGDAVIKEVRNGKANIGIAGLYVTSERIQNVDISHSHSQDCAAFISLTSTALPRYRAIMGPFQWTVWLAVTLTYLFAIFPLAFSDRHTLSHLIDEPGEVENMFWYVFGTFTNCFSFTGNKSWSKTTKYATRTFVGCYWIFTIIITACYTGSIIAFVTLPIFPATVDTVKQLLSGGYQIVTLDKGGWQYWFNNSTDVMTTKLLKDMEYVPTVETGLLNTTRAFFWKYAFLGSKSELDYIVRTNFSTKARRSLLHISSECFVPYGIALSFPLNTIYRTVINHGILRITESGFTIKYARDVEWDTMRSATGKLLQASGGGSLRALRAEDRALTLDDTQGMFLLLGIGFILGGASLLSEWLGGCFNLCKLRRANSSFSINSNRRSFHVPTPREKLDSIHYENCVAERLANALDPPKENDETDSDGHEILNQTVSNCVVHYSDANSADNKATANDNLTNNISKTNSSNCLQDHRNDSDIDYDEEINRLFNANDLFGEETNSSNCGHTFCASSEELISDEEYSKRK